MCIINSFIKMGSSRMYYFEVSCYFVWMGFLIDYRVDGKG